VVCLSYVGGIIGILVTIINKNNIIMCVWVNVTLAALPCCINKLISQLIVNTWTGFCVLISCSMYAYNATFFLHTYSKIYIKVCHRVFYVLIL